jgi:hypothetical protein
MYDAERRLRTRTFLSGSLRMYLHAYVRVQGVRVLSCRLSLRIYVRDVYVGTYVRMMNSRETACRHCRRTCMHAHADAQTNSEQTWRLIIHSFYSQVVSIFFFFTEIFVEPCVPRVHGSNHRNRKIIGL